VLEELELLFYVKGWNIFQV